MSSQSQKSQALLSLWGHLVLTSIAKQTHTHIHPIHPIHTHSHMCTHTLTHAHTYTLTHAHTHTQELTGNCAFLLSQKKTHSV